MFVNNAVSGDDPRLEAVYSNYEANLRGIVDAARSAGARTILCTVVANLKDCPPFLSRHRTGLSDGELSAFKAAFDGGSLAWRLGETDRSRALLSEALQIDAQYADTHFMLGSLDLRSGDISGARRHFVDALHWDALRFRPDPRINQIVRRVAGSGAKNDIVLVDCAMALGSDGASAAPPSGRELLFEHVHFDWDGNYRVARMIAEDIDAGQGGAPRLDSAGCAVALAFTPHERLPMLLGMDVLVRRPPFSNQLTYVADQAWMAREIDRAKRDGMTPDAPGPCGTGGEEKALSQDPENPALAGILEGIDLDLGDLDGALSLARRAQQLLPRDPALSADEASILMRSGRFAEAEQVLMKFFITGRDLDLIVPVLVDFWTRTKRYEEGERYLGRAPISRNPADRRLRLARAGSHARGRGQHRCREREYRGGARAGPRKTKGALEALLGLLDEAGRTADLPRLRASPRRTSSGTTRSTVCGRRKSMKDEGTPTDPSGCWWRPPTAGR